ncbi:hypothetical protein PVAG01_06787 [Phlyctema vagabunda]|uniref:Zn(2)-C6 fungal-type domain-containing protein n=1 Tax=Phlyctema vagabunda TaxID=108571 RepID=A0ABR4PI12_9HELO
MASSDDSDKTNQVCLPRKNGRLGKPKVRTGCITCKVRRIKCDEGKPNCHRCTSTGRKCDGYLILKKPLDDKLVSKKLWFEVGTPIPLPLPIVLKESYGSKQELRCFEFFLVHTAPTLSGWFDERFWRTQLPQVSHDEETIRHAMIAAASVHEQMEMISDAIVGNWTPDNIELETRRRFALSQYNAAIASLRKRISENSDPVEITLACCIVFICIEFLRGNFATAVLHLHSGLQIMSKWRRDWPPDKVVTPLSLEDNLIRIFERLSFQSTLTDKPLAHLHPDIQPPEVAYLGTGEETFSSLLIARYSLDYINKECLNIIREGKELCLMPDTSERKMALEIEQRRQRVKIEQWSTKFDRFMMEHETTMTARERTGAEEMRILQLVASVWVEASLQFEESTFDAYTETFEKIVVLAERLYGDTYALEARQQHTRARYFSFEMGSLPPLYFVATKCRHRQLRRRALALLHKASPRREGMWNCGLLASVAVRAIELEEDGMDPAADFPHEDKRVHDTSGMTSKDEWSAIESTCPWRTEHGDFELELGPRSQMIGFVFRPGGIDGKWEVKRELLYW